MGLILLVLDYKTEVGDSKENGKNFGHQKYPMSDKMHIHVLYLTVPSKSKLENSM